MNKQNLGRSTGLRTILGIGSALITSMPSGFCQITPDDTLGTERSTVTSNILIKGELGNQIEGGALRGANLFHSFREFNVNSGQRVYFFNPNGVSNILTRVTGNTPSNILGKLGVDGSANLFLINPNGIIFGANARLDIQGSFTASTASQLTFPNGEQFSAIDPQTPPLLTINVPIGLQYGSQAGQIVNAGLLEVGQDLSLSGSSVISTGQMLAPNGDIRLTGVLGDVEVKHLNARTATLTATQNLNLLESQLTTTGDLNLLAQNSLIARDSVTSPLIVQAGGHLLLQGDRLIDIFALNHSNSGLASVGNMTLRSANTVIGDAHYWSGGNFQIEQLDGNLGSLSSPTDPVIRSSGDVSFQFYSGGSLHIFAGGSVTIPIGVQITGSDPVNGLVDTITLSDGTPLPINGRIQPTLDIRAGTTAFGAPGITGGGFFFPAPPPINAAATGANIVVGSIVITQPNGLVLLTNQYSPNALPGNILVNGFINVGGSLNGAPSATGNGGSVYIDSKGSLQTRNVINTSGINTFFSPFIPTSQAVPPFNYNAGNITLLANNDLATSHLLASGVLGGRIRLASPALISSSNSIINTTSVSATPNARGGDIQVDAGAVLLDNTSLTTNAFLNAQGGNILIRATESVTMTGLDGGLYAQTNGAGNAGNVEVNTRNFTVRDGAVISTSTFDSGKSGDITVNASESVQVIGNNFLLPPSFLSTQTAASGNSGDLKINTRNLVVRDGGVILSANSRENAFNPEIGASGNIEIIASESMQVTGRSSVTTFTDNDQSAGNIKITTGNLLVQDGGSQIATYPTDVATGRGGDIALQANQLIVQQGAQVLAGTFGDGQGGNLEINVSDLVQVIGDELIPRLPGQRLPSSLSAASSFGRGNAGNLTIATGKLIIQAGGTVTTETNGAGRAGDLKVIASESIKVVGANASGRVSQLTATTTGSGNAGNLILSTQNLLVQDGGLVTAETRGSGRAGNLSIAASNSVQVAGDTTRGVPSQVTARTFGFGNAGDLRLTTKRLLVQDGGQITAYTTNQGRAGTLTARADDSIDLNGVTSRGFPSTIAFDTFSSGDAGELRVETSRLTLRDGGRVSAATSGAGRGGIIVVDASDTVDIAGTSPNGQFASGLFFDSRSAGNARGIRVDTNQLTVYDRGQITVSGSGLGQAGDVEVNARSVLVDSQGEITATTNSSLGGNVRLQGLDSLVMNNGSRISTSTVDGQGGIVDVSAREVVRIGSGSQLASEATGSGLAGGVRVATRALNVQDGAQVSVSNTGSGNAGNLEVAANSVWLSNSGRLTAETRSGSGGNIQFQGLTSLTLNDGSEISTSTIDGLGGTIDIVARQAVVLNRGSRLSAESLGTGVAGTIRVDAQTIAMTDQTRITGRTASGEGGNIQLNARESITLHRDSDIRTQALGSGNGGNINLQAGTFILGILSEDSDVIASAVTGKGGKIDAKAIGIFGFRLFDGQETPDSDFVASSEFGIDGTVTINAQNPQTLPPLPAEPGVPQIALGCQALNQQQGISRFFNSGRGGLPPNPNHILSSSAVWEDAQTSASPSTPLTLAPNPQSATAIIEAQGWIKHADGSIALVVEPTPASPYIPVTLSADCYAR